MNVNMPNSSDSNTNFTGLKPQGVNEAKQGLPGVWSMKYGIEWVTYSSILSPMTSVMTQ